MSTNAWIGAVNSDGSVKVVYLHYDGNRAGQILNVHYQDPVKVAELISNGDMSSLGKDIGEKHDFNDYFPDQCTFYKRDRDEDDCDAKFFKSVDDVLSAARKLGYIEYLYLYENYEWISHDVWS